LFGPKNGVPIGAVDVEVDVLLVALAAGRDMLGELVMREVKMALELLDVERPKVAE